MTSHPVAAIPLNSYKKSLRGQAGRIGLLHSCSIPALALGLVLSGAPAFAGCLTIGTAYPCTGATDETLNAGPADNLVYSGGATGNLTVNGEGGVDSIVFSEESTLAAKSGGTIADGGAGNDLITVQDNSSLTGNILGGADNDNILAEGASTLTGSIDGGLGDDTLTLRDAGTIVTGDVTGGDGADTIMLRDASTVQGNVDAGAGADRITLKLGTTLEGDLLAGADNDTVLIRGSSSVESDLDLGAGNDTLTIQESSQIDGSVYGLAGADIMLLEGDTIDGSTDSGSTIGGNFDGGEGNDTMGVRGRSTVTGDVVGGADNDGILISGRSTVGGGISGDGGDDQITVQQMAVVEGAVNGGDGLDSLLVEGNATVQGALSGGNGADLINVTSGDVQGGISAGDGADTVNLSGGRIGGYLGGASIEMDGGDDTLNLTFNSTLGTDALDLVSVLDFNGGTGANTATVTGFDADYSEGGLFNRSFTGWNSVTAIGSYLQFASTPTISGLSLTASSGLYQTTGALSLTAADGSDTATLSVDGTSFVDLRDAAFGPVLTFAPFGPTLPTSLADDSLTVANLSLTGSADPLAFPTLRVDFDAGDTSHQTFRDDVDAGKADYIAALSSISTSGTIGIQIDAAGGYLNMGMPVGLSGSVAIIDDMQADALARPVLGTALVASATYVPVSAMPIDPARQWALVDQGEGGVYLQWTTLINEVTVGPNGGAELAIAQGGIAAMGAVLAGLTDGTIAAKPLCAGTPADCAFAPASVWMMAGGSTLDLGAVGGFSGVETNSRHLTAGVEFAPQGSVSTGLFASLHLGSSDLGSVAGAFGSRASGAEHKAAFVGAYLRAEQGGSYANVMGAVGKASSELVNGALFGATSDHDSVVSVISANAGQRVTLGNGLTLDPRIEAAYASSNGDTYSESGGLTVSASGAQTRLAATVGLTYRQDTSPLALTLRAGTAFLISDTDVTAGETGFGGASSRGQRSDKVFTASVEGSYAFSDKAALVGSISADRGDDIETARGGLTFTYAF